MPDFNQMQRQRLAAKRQAMPDGGFPIRNVSDLKNAIQAFGRAKNKPAVKAWIKKRARELGATNLLPDNWRDDTLVHYGVKGMKWGIRRYQDKNGRLTELGKKHKRELSSNESNLVEQANGDYVLKKGTIVQRMSDSKESSLRSERTYVSFTKQDNDVYERNFKEILTWDNPDAPVYKNTLVLKEDLKIPSHDKVVNVFIDMFQQSPEYMSKVMGDTRRLSDIQFHGTDTVFSKFRDPNNPDWRNTRDRVNEFYKKRYSKMTMSELREDAYYDFINHIADADEYVQNYFYGQLKKQGYNAIIDDNDALGLGHRTDDENDILPEKPIVVFDASESLENRASVKSKLPRKYTMDLLKEEVNSPEFQESLKQNRQKYRDWVDDQLKKHS